MEANYRIALSKLSIHQDREVLMLEYQGNLEKAALSPLGPEICLPRIRREHQDKMNGLLSLEAPPEKLIMEVDEVPLLVNSIQLNSFTAVDASGERTAPGKGSVDFGAATSRMVNRVALHERMLKYQQMRSQGSPVAQIAREV